MPHHLVPVPFSQSSPFLHSLTDSISFFNQVPGWRWGGVETGMGEPSNGEWGQATCREEGDVSLDEDECKGFARSAGQALGFISHLYLTLNTSPGPGELENHNHFLTALLGSPDLFLCQGVTYFLLYYGFSTPTTYPCLLYTSPSPRDS